MPLHPSVAEVGVLFVGGQDILKAPGATHKSVVTNEGVSANGGI